MKLLLWVIYANSYHVVWMTQFNTMI